MNQIKIIIIVFFAYLLLFSPNAYAYLDPGTGSYLLQILAAVLFGSIFVIKLWWNKIKSFFIKSKKDDSKK